jgi:hypothetical protein
MTEEVTQEVQEEATAAPGLGLNDLVFLLNTIDVCSARGAFRGNELTNVGQIRDKLDAFVRANMPAEDQPEEDAADAEQSE